MSGTRSGHDVTLVTFDTPGTEPFFALDPGVSLRELAASASRGLSAKLGTNIARVSRLRSVLRELHPDVVVAFMTEANVIALWASRGLGVPVVISERNQPDRPGLGHAHKLARRLTYPTRERLGRADRRHRLMGEERASAFRFMSFPIRFALAPAMRRVRTATCSGSFRSAVSRRRRASIS